MNDLISIAKSEVRVFYVLVNYIIEDRKKERKKHKKDTKIKYQKGQLDKLNSIYDAVIIGITQ